LIIRFIDFIDELKTSTLEHLKQPCFEEWCDKTDLRTPSVIFLPL